MEKSFITSGPCLNFDKASNPTEKTYVPVNNAGNHWPTSEKPLNGVLLAGQSWPDTECSLGSFHRPGEGWVVFLNKPSFIYLFFQRERCPDPRTPILLWIRAWTVQL